MIVTVTNSRRSTPGRPLVHRLAEPIICVALFLGASIWATQFWNEWTRQGNQPEFYQLYFEPAVMVACHRGFLISEHQPKPLEDFLWRRRDALSCAELPADLNLSTKNLYQGAWTYLQYMVGLSWRVLGISWSGMGPLFGVLFGAVVTLAYGIFRLGMGRTLGVFCAIGIATSPIHLINLPHLRDYSKAPFTLALVLILGLLVARQWSARAVVAWCAAYGAVLGVGYGFRTDLLINVPLFVLVLFGFLAGGVTRNLLVKAAATLAFAGTFYVTSLPITTAVVERGGCQWHVALLGLQSTFDPALGLTPAPYDFGHAYADGYITRTVAGYAHRMHPDDPPPVYCSPAYDRESGGYLMSIVSTFPGDFVTRAYAAVTQVVELPYSMLAQPVADWASPVFSLRLHLVYPRFALGLAIALAALVVASAASVRLGLCLMFLMAYIGGYPAVQFQGRHYFHLEFIGWWLFGFVACYCGRWALDVTRGKVDARTTLRRAAINSAIVAGVGIVVFGPLLIATRVYQQKQAEQLIASHLAAPKTTVADPSGPLSNVTARDWPQLLVVEVNAAACGPQAAITFRYDPAVPNGDFTRTVRINDTGTAAGTTTVLATVFENYAGLSLADAGSGCLAGVSRLANLEGLPVLLAATLPADWRDRPLYQRVTRFEGR